MPTYIYLSLLPESLVVSMLRPEEFGTYFAVGTQKRSRGQAMFFVVDPAFRHAYFDLESAIRRCVPRPDGRPKNSVYVSIYRVLEHVPLEAVGSLWLVTDDGRSLELKGAREVPQVGGQFHLYQEICPVHPQIASTLGPREFCRFITDPATRFHVPRIVFADLDLGGLSDDPVGGQADDLPYPHLRHLRDCLAQLQRGKETATKTLDRTTSPEFPYRLIRTGLYLGDPQGMRVFPLPSREALDREYHDWWRSANT